MVVQFLSTAMLGPAMVRYPCLLGLDVRMYLHEHLDNLATLPKGIAIWQQPISLCN